MIHRLGGTRLMENRIALFRNHAGKPVGLMGIARDETERRKVEEKLLFSKEKLYQTVYGTPIPTFVIDRDHVVTHWNRVLESLTRRQPMRSWAPGTAWLPY